MARRLGSLRRPLLAGLALGVGALLVYVIFLEGSEVAPTLTVELPTAAIGSGEEAVAVASNGAVLASLPPPKEGSLPQLSLEKPPKSGRLRGPALEQVRVLAAAPVALRPYLASSFYGETGVDVKLKSGIELRFGDATRATEKWRAAATVLADPEITALDYVDLHAPGRPSVGGSGKALPPAP
jgi:hypothetical protein